MSDGIEGIHGVTEADEQEIGLCPCGKGYNGHTPDHTSCTKCGDLIDADEILWVDVSTGHPAGPPIGDPFHVGCDPAYYGSDL